MKSKTLLLVNPANQLRTGFHINVATRNQPLGLGIIAALTPPDWKIKLIDENFRPFRHYDADLVGLTAFTSSAPRAYEIAEGYRSRGIPTVMGGIHASMLPDEATRFVDVVVEGEAEGTWPDVIRDFESGSLKKRYSAKFEKIIKQPLPRRDLFHPAYVAASIQTTRGCPLNCTFCSVSAFNGRHYRFRPVEEVLEEYESVPQEYVFFIDDNIIGHSSETKQRAALLFEGIIRRGIKKHWISQSSLNFGDDPELLKLAARSGCRMIFLGIEAESEEQLTEANKKVNLRMGTESYKSVFRNIQRHGIGVIAGLILGWDSDTKESIAARATFALRCGADSFQTSVLTPLPGTELFERMRKEDRLLYTNFPQDWQRYDYFEPTIKHPVMDTLTLDDAAEEAKRRIYAMPAIWYRGFVTLLRTRKMITTFMLNLNYRHYRNIFLKGRGKIVS